MASTTVRIVEAVADVPRTEQIENPHAHTGKQDSNGFVESPMPSSEDGPPPFSTSLRFKSSSPGLNEKKMQLSPPPSMSLDSADSLDGVPPMEDHVTNDNDQLSLTSLENRTGVEGDETARMSSSVGSMPFDAAPGFPPEVLGALSNPSIEENTPAAEALRANANVHVRKVGKVARSVNAQALRRLVKRATMRARSGNVRGKPPRIPPPRPPSTYNSLVAANTSNAIFILKEEDEAEKSVHSLIDSIKNDDLSRLSDRVEEHTEENIVENDVTEHIVDNDDMNHKDQTWHARFTDDFAKVPTEVLTATMETGKKILGTVDPHEILQTQRWRRRKLRGKSGNRKSYVKGKVINGEHELYTLSIAVMLGVRTSIGTTNSQMCSNKGKRWLSSDDFMATEKYEFSPKGGPRTPPHQLSHTFKFKDYSPLAFAYLRRMFGVNEFDFLLSVCGNANFIEFISNAKSGQFFFYSSDGKFMIKTMTNVESKFLRRILPHYFRHCAQNPNTLITKFLGMYRVKMYHLRRNVKFVIMNSVYYTDKNLQSFYDLKGSVVGRESKPGQDVKKDNDLRKHLPDSAIALPPVVRERVRQQIVADCEFMQRMKIMDYSMLIGVHNIPSKSQGGEDTNNSVEKAGFNLSKARYPSLTLRELVKKRSVTSPGHQSFPSVSSSLGDMSIVTQLSSMAINANDTAPGSPKNPIEKSKSRRLRSSFTEAMIDDHLGTFQLGEHGYDDDDDNSYLEGSEKCSRPGGNWNGTERSVSKFDDSFAKIDDIEVKKEQTIERIYWPFHQYYDIYGYRRMVPRRCLTCDTSPCSCNGSGQVDDAASWRIPSFVPPLSDRKDGGLMMDTTGFDLPLKVKTNGKEQNVDGKIFYMGVIDILQQYNIRKRLEARYRRMHGSGWHDASCVHPRIYADRFISFFDEYSQRPTSKGPVVNYVELKENEEQIVFEREVQEEEKREIELDMAHTGNTRIASSGIRDVVELTHLKND